MVKQSGKHLSCLQWVARSVSLSFASGVTGLRRWRVAVSCSKSLWSQTTFGHFAPEGGRRSSETGVGGNLWRSDGPDPLLPPGADMGMAGERAKC